MYYYWFVYNFDFVPFDDLNYVIKYSETVYARNGKNLLWSIKNSGEILNKLKSKGFLASSVSIYDLSTLYTTLPHNLIKEKIAELNFTSDQHTQLNLWSCQEVCDALHYLLDNIFIRFV